ncbi:MAG: DUF5058 family protein [Oscillospiraceae bacterium]|nr:DUF5058 family protein [Oscillospiraceae bacterium]MCL2280009.1 DUF5058 family protein [Oscillospiraceae bacterium]
MAVFDSNSPFLYVLAVIIVIFVLAQSTFFLVKAWKQARKIGMDKSASLSCVCLTY